MVQVQCSGSVGEWLFPICFGRILATRFGYELSSMSVSGLGSSKDIVAGDEFFAPLITWHGQWPFDAHTGRRIENHEMYCAPGGRLNLIGKFQRFELISNYREEIRNSWLCAAEPLPRRNCSDLIICMGSEDKFTTNESIRHDGQLDEMQIRKLANLNKGGTTYLISPHWDQKLEKLCGAFGFVYIVESGLNALLFIRAFTRIAFSQCITYWWGAFLGKPKEIYFPDITKGIWSKPDPAILAHESKFVGIDVRVDEENYIYEW